MNRSELIKKVKELEDNQKELVAALNQTNVALTQTSTALTEQLALLWALQEHLGITDGQISDLVMSKREKIAEFRNGSKPKSRIIQ